MIAIAIGCWFRWEAGLLFAGTAIVLIGAVTDDEAVGMALRRGTAWVRYGWWRQIAKENGNLSPDSPHPPIHIDPEAQARAERMAKARQERSRLHDRTQALSRIEYDELERLG